MIQFNDKLDVTDQDLSQMANSWAKLLPNEDIGIRTAFAHGFKAALSEVKKLNKSDVIKSVCPKCSGTKRLPGYIDIVVKCDQCNGTGETVL